MYDTTGLIVGVPDRDNLVPADLDGLRAPSVAADEWGGWVLIDMAGADFSLALIDSIGKEITADQGRLAMEDMILHDVVGWDVPANYSPIGTVDVMQIGQLAQTSGLTAKTIRYYESVGLLNAPARTPGGYRIYGHEALERLDFIRQAKASGLTLAEIASILEIKEKGGQSCDHAKALLAEHLLALDVKIDELCAARAELQRLSARAGRLDPAQCTDANRCQVIASARVTS